MGTLDEYKMGRIIPSELSSLSEEIDSLSDSQLKSKLSKDWESFESSGPLGARKIRRMYPSDRIRGGRHGMVRSGVFLCCLAFALVCAASALFFALRTPSVEPLSATTFTVSSGIDGPSSMTLPDGTSVRLNARSVLSYNSDFGITDRRVSIVGEGFFDVAKDNGKKFVVETPDMEITVHGTRFNVYAYPERSVDEMSLVSGRVTVVTNGNTFRLSPGEKIFYDKSTGGTYLTKTDNRMELAWLGQELSFNQAPLSYVFDVLERRFGVTICCGEGIDMNDRYTASFTDRRIKDIMEVLRMHYHFDYSFENNIIKITKK